MGRTGSLLEELEHQEMISRMALRFHNEGDNIWRRCLTKASQEFNKRLMQADNDYMERMRRELEIPEPHCENPSCNIKLDFGEEHFCTECIIKGRF
jgi:hypothetical protein